MAEGLGYLDLYFIDFHNVHYCNSLLLHRKLFLYSSPTLLAIEESWTRVRQALPFLFTFVKPESGSAKAAKFTSMLASYASGFIGALSQSKMN